MPYRYIGPYARRHQHHTHVVRTHMRYQRPKPISVTIARPGSEYRRLVDENAGPDDDTRAFVMPFFDRNKDVRPIYIAHDPHATPEDMSRVLSHETLHHALDDVHESLASSALDDARMRSPRLWKPRGFSDSELLEPSGLYWRT